MNITKENIDALNAVVKIDITGKDYQDKVAEILKDYRNKADIPGFRKGHVPMSLVKKQYEKPIIIDEVNKLLQDSLNKYIVEEKLDILGNPIPKPQDDFSWDADNFTFEFELGLSPEFEINLKPKKAIEHYTIVADDKIINQELTNIQERFGKVISKDTIEKGNNITGTFVNEEKEINKKATINLSKIKGKDNEKKFIGAKIGDVLTLKTKGLFTDDHDLMHALGINHDDVHDLNVEIQFTIEEITETQLAELNQELFDKVFGAGKVTSEQEVKDRLKADIEKQFIQQSDQQLLTAVSEYLIENTKFELPADFLKKWISVSGEQPISTEQAEEEYSKSEKGLRFQMIEGKIMKDNNIQVDFEQLKEFVKGFIKVQMAQFGNANPEEKELDEIATRVLSNQDETKRLQEQLVSKKMLDFYKENVNLNSKEVTFDQFVKEVYK